ncbi:somatostatin receptor type 5-like [Episyrphus balteatus]|uniref:somatostatin receptor type 5-like n=1 Tax=Episyrphus balteatus TaxID=286459 RepID=UPI00248646A6|nr:somatostatin receptor type 5-like [Episyrphus balteatus]
MPTSSSTAKSGPSISLIIIFLLGSISLSIGEGKSLSTHPTKSSMGHSSSLHLDEYPSSIFIPNSLDSLQYLWNNSSTGQLSNDTSSNSSFFDEDGMCPTSQNAIGNFITMVLYAAVCIVGLFGNTLVIYVVLRFSKMQTVTNIYILNLAIADECFLIGIPFLLFTMQIGSWKFGEYMCKAYMVSTSITQFTSSIFLLIMSADRYIAVCHPISSPRYRTPMVSKIVSGVAWMASAVLMLPVILFANTVVVYEDHLSCNIKWPESHNTQSGTTFILYTLILGFATPLSFILCFYYMVIRKLHTVGPKNKSKEKKRSHRKVTKLVLTVITVYILCWLPYWISQVALINSRPDMCASRLEITIFLLVGCLGYSNSAMNPILYAFLSDNFKKSFMKACSCAARKDINAQLQLENSFFPKFGKNKQKERLLSSKAKAKVARNNNVTTTVTTATVVGDSGTIAYTDATDAGYGGSKLNATILSNSGNSSTTNTTGNGEQTLSTTITSMSGKPPVLHTDL